MTLSPCSWRVARSVASTWNSCRAPANALGFPTVQSCTFSVQRFLAPIRAVEPQQNIGKKRHAGLKTRKQQARWFSLEAPREPVAGSEPGINIRNENAWPEWRQKKVQVGTRAISMLLTTCNSIAPDEKRLAENTLVTDNGRGFFGRSHQQTRAHELDPSRISCKTS